MFSLLLSHILEAPSEICWAHPILVRRVLCLATASFRGVGRVRARTLANHGYRTPLEICRITKNAAQKLADERGWSPLLVQNIMQAAERAIQTKR